MAKRTVRVGQVWRSTDRRDRYWDKAVYRYRELRVVSIYPWGYPEPFAFLTNTRTGKSSRILLRRLEYRLGGRGYDLVEDILPEENYQI